ncbi:hypothetical protein [Mesobacillus maritimus]|uniref:hypothetical protein n=1 Tax=Mesobacillus maritimus TaxID=1643336 RepID=UPI00384AB26B
MKILHSFLPLFIFSSLFLFGCNYDKDETESKLIASEKSLPANFHEIAFERETAPFFQYLVKKASSQSAFEETWSLFEFTSRLPKVNLNEKEVLFIGVQESGSCPYEVQSSDISADKKTLTVRLSEPKGACTDDATPRTFVFELDKAGSQEVDNVVIVQSGVETSLPLE